MNHQKANWKRRFFTIWTGQAVSLITSAILQMAMIWYLTEKRARPWCSPWQRWLDFYLKRLGGP